MQQKRPQGFPDVAAISQPSINGCCWGLLALKGQKRKPFMIQEVFKLAEPLFSKLKAATFFFKAQILANHSNMLHHILEESNTWMLPRRHHRQKILVGTVVESCKREGGGGGGGGDSPIDLNRDTGKIKCFFRICLLHLDFPLLPPP